MNCLHNITQLLNSWPRLCEWPHVLCYAAGDQDKQGWYNLPTNIFTLDRCYIMLNSKLNILKAVPLVVGSGCNICYNNGASYKNSSSNDFGSSPSLRCNDKYSYNNNVGSHKAHYKKSGTMDDGEKYEGTFWELFISLTDFVSAVSDGATEAFQTMGQGWRETLTRIVTVCLKNSLLDSLPKDFQSVLKIISKWWPVLGYL